jgi:FixJ family two-component response regulator
MEAKPTVFVVDDDPSVRRALNRLIESVGLAARSYASAPEFLNEATSDVAGCLVLDLRMPGMSGLDLQRTLVERQIGLPIIFMSAHGDVPSSVRAMKAGAVDFLEKPFSEQALLDAVHAALRWDAQMRTARSRRDDVLRRVESLTPREREVFALVVVGRMSKEIAVELAISEVTVKVHRGRVMTKMGADSVAELVHLAQAAGMSTTKR